MEFLFFIAPWAACIILAMLLSKEKKLRRSENEHAQNEIKNIRSATTAEAQTKVNSALQEAKEKIAQVEARTQSELCDMRAQAELRIREERESIRLNKESLQALNEKELLVECMSALGTYAQRMDRLENRMSNMAISLDEVIRRSSAEKKPYTYTGRITDDDLIQIVRTAAKRIDRITEITVNAAVVKGVVLSQHKLSTWAFLIDFNDDGQLTGVYTIISENYDSNIPQRLAEEISKEIVYRLNSNRK